MPYQLIDKLPAWGVIAVTAAILALASAVGRRLGLRRAPEESAIDSTHAGATVGALLALLGLLLAFAFSGVEARFAARKQLVLDDANAIGTTFLRAGMLDAEQRDTVRAALSDYVDLRLAARTPAAVATALKGSDQLHRTLWRQSEEAAERHPRSVMVGLFVSSLNEMIDLHQKRVTVGLYQRMPPTTLVVLGAVASLSLGVLGYLGGANRSRARVPGAAMILAISCVTMLILELDRPYGSLFHVSQDAMRDVRATIDAYGKSSPPPPS